MKIGIRPVIDRHMYGHDQNTIDMTVRMAQATARLIKNNFRDIDGQLFECILPKGVIACAKEAAECADYFEQKQVAATVTVTPTWCHSTEVMDMSKLPKAVWGMNGTDLPGAVFLGAVISAYAQKGLPVYTIYGRDVQDSPDEGIPADVAEKILRFVRCAAAVEEMRGKSYLAIGSMSLGMTSSIPDIDFFEKYLGMRCEYCDMSEVIRRIDSKIYDEDEFKRAFEWVKAYCREGIDTNQNPASRDNKDKQWERVVKMTLVVRDLMQGNPKIADNGYLEESIGRNAIAAGFQGAREWTDFMPNGDFMESILNSSFDWNGKRSPIIVATENDSLNAATMLFGKLLTNSAQIFTDVRTYWSPVAIIRATEKQIPEMLKYGVIHLTNSGPMCIDATGMQEKDDSPAMKPFWEITDEEIEKCMDAVVWCPASQGSFPGGGFSSRLVSRGGMPVTLSRLNIIKGIGPALQLAEGLTIDVPDEIGEVIDKRTDPTCPMAWFVPRLNGQDVFKDVYQVMANWGSNHGALSYGHIGADLITLASMLRIPVYMHNVEENRLFRPHVWNSFGTKNSETADLLACGIYRSLY